MKGQWFGTFSGTNNGGIMVNIDELSSSFGGVAYLSDSNIKLPSIAVFFQTKNKHNDFIFNSYDIRPINPLNGSPDNWNNVRALGLFDPAILVPENIPKALDVKGIFTDETLVLAWKTDIGTKGSCELIRDKASNVSYLVPKPLNWTEFKEHISGFEGRRFLYRGQQNNSWKLRTSFHRTGRADLTRYIREDINMLHRRLSARTKHIFNLSVPDENGAFFNLVQHHGYPTPLLDWSYSPYVAGFFAFRGISTKDSQSPENSHKKVRILVFDQAKWTKDLGKLFVLDCLHPHLSVMEFIAVENERMIPQQSVSTMTNIDDIEVYIKLREQEKKAEYLWGIDLPITERKKVIQDLSYMGITAGSLFPGLDGACEELKERNFDI